MAIAYDPLMALTIPEVTQTYRPKNCILYALGVGLGLDSLDESELAFVYERSLKVLPNQARALGYLGSWICAFETGIDWRKVVHGEQRRTLHRPLRPSGTVIGKTRVVDSIDKGAEKGAIIVGERMLRDAADGEPNATLRQMTFCRGDGGFGGAARPQAKPHELPERAPDRVVDMATTPDAALIYRRSGDFNPLHVDPAAARAAGFPQPILRGLDFGVAGHAILREMCRYEPGRMRSIRGRFSAPVYPGDTNRIEMWGEGTVSFRARVLERDVIGINNGRTEIVL